MKTQNIKKLEAWYESIGCPTLIPIDEAKKLYRNMVQSSSKEEQKKIYQELVMGTIPVVYQNIKNSYFPYIAYHEFDIEDILYAGIEIWMDYLQKGRILEVPYYSFLFKYSQFFWRLKKSFVDASFHVSTFFTLRDLHLSNLFLEYLENKEEIRPQLSSSIQKLFDDIFNLLNTEIHLFEQEKEISKRKLILIMPFLIQKVLNKTYNENPKFLYTLTASDAIQEVENKIMRKELNDLLNSLQLKKSYQQILYAYYVKHLSLNDIAMIYQCRKQNINQKHQRLLQIIKNADQKELYKEYDLTKEDSPFQIIKKR